MIVTGRIEEVRHIRWADTGRTWGLVPTMGYLHEGHLSLVERAGQENDKVAASLFVNPTQFAPDEDLETYPRDFDRDKALLKSHGVDLLFVPGEGQMYPPGFQTKVTVGRLTQVLEGAARPEHFQGVTTVVSKLFNIVQPTRAYFGQKDAQQSIVLQQLVRDLNFNLQIVVCPTVREPDGLAMSSRNAYLTPAERKAATVLYRALCEARKAIKDGEKDADVVRRILRSKVDAEPLADLDYASVADSCTLEEMGGIKGRILLSMAVFIGGTRLIDNLIVATDDS